jgi:hypothetical protein
VKNSVTRSLQGPAFTRSWLQRIQQGAAVRRQELGHGSTEVWGKDSCSQGPSPGPGWTSSQSWEVAKTRSPVT